MRQHPSADKERVTDLLELATDLPVESVPRGAVLIAEGAGPGRLLVLESGTVTVERAGVAVARIDSPGAVLGEMSVVLDKPATSTLRLDGLTQYLADVTRRGSARDPEGTHDH